MDVLASLLQKYYSPMSFEMLLFATMFGCLRGFANVRIVVGRNSRVQVLQSRWKNTQ